MIVKPSLQRWAADLRWLFTAADGELGLRSNFQGMVASLESGGRTSGRSDYDVTPQQIHAATRARTICQALEQMPVWARVVLGIAYRRNDGEAALMCALSSTTLEHRRSRTKREPRDWLERTRRSRSNQRRLMYAKLRHEATDLVEEALDLYAQARSELARGRAAQETSA